MPRHKQRRIGPLNIAAMAIWIAAWGGAYLYFWVIWPATHPEEVAIEKARDAAEQVQWRKRFVALEAEFGPIQHPSTARMTSFEFNKQDIEPWESSIKAVFDMDPVMSWESLRAYYDAELPKHGWSVTCEKRWTEWGVDKGDVTSVYQKGEFFAFVSGNRFGENQSFRFNMGFRNWASCPRR